MRTVQRLFTALAVAALLPSTALSQQRGVVTGQVTDETTGSPLVGATVTVAGTSLGALTDQQGNYRIPNVPAGPREVTASVLGYGQQRQTITVAAGGTATANFALEQTALEIGGVVVTATGQQQRTREIGNSVGVINVPAVELAPVTSFSDLLQGRMAGVSVLQSSGTSGTGSRIRIRGSTSISLSNSPLLIIDGVRVDDNPDSYGLFTGGQTTSRLNDITPESIEQIEVLRGPAAAALYGTAAASGVIQVTTKRGGRGDAQWRFWAEARDLDQNFDFPANFLAVGTRTNGNQAECSLVFFSLGACVDVDSVRTFNPLMNDETTPFRNGRGQTYGTSVSGGSDAATYYIMGEVEDETGVQEENELERVNLRANITGYVNDRFTLGATVGYTDSNIQLPQNDNSGSGILFNGLFARPTPFVVETNQGYLSPRPSIFSWDQFQDLTRFTAGLRADWDLLPWLALNATAGLDDVNRGDNDLIPPNVPGQTGIFAEGFREVNPFKVRNLTMNTAATATYGLASDLVATTSVGSQYHREATQELYLFGSGLAPEVRSIAGVSANFDIGEANTEVVTLGGFVQHQFAWRDRVFVTGALRGDDNSAFGTNLDFVWYPSVSASWVLSEEAFFPRTRAISNLRLRSAWGRSGLRPSFRDAQQFFSGVTAATLEGEVPGFVIAGAGNPDLEPEIVTEYELGFETGLVDDRIGIDFTYFNKESENSLLNRVLPPSLGTTTSRRENLGSVSNKGIELVLTAAPVRTPNFDWNLSFAASTNDNELTSLGGEPDVIFGLLGNTQRHREGFPLGSYFQNPIEDFEDRNGDGFIGFDDAGELEVEVGDSVQFLGQPFPTREYTFSSDVSLGGIVRLSGMLDFKGGHTLFNATRWGRCVAFRTCEEISRPQEMTLAEQAEVVAAQFDGTAAAFFEDADFWKLREIALTFSVPQAWYERLPIGTEALSLTVAGRNLKTWTDYTGFDPEINSAGQANFNTFDVSGMPPIRSWTLRVDATF